MRATKFTLALVLSIFVMDTAFSQKDKSKRPSPPAQISKEINGKTITVDYSRPSKKDRTIYGGLVSYDKVWRTGANEATWIEFSDDVKINGNSLAAGKYGLFTIPGEDQWTVIFNKTWDQWGSGRYSKSDDVLRVDVNSSSTSSTEMLTFMIDDSGEVSFAWDETKVAFSVE